MSSRTKEEPRPKEIPEIVVDPGTRRKFARGKFLGKGGFAKCYELTDMESREIFAGKIVSKTLLTKQNQKEKMSQEIQIHRDLAHKHIVKFYTFFEDADNVYIILELCRRRSLMELHKRRKTVTEVETKYFMHQILLACKYLHDNRIIHRDLKLGNLFLNDDMEVKIGDFGLATKVCYDGERKNTLCGTPNYIAPEVLSKLGHSYEVDVWSLGCIMYTLLVGKPPFETNTLKETYTKIKKNEYHIPSRISMPARSLIQRLLQSDPTKRPNMEQILRDDFLVAGYMPSRLPTSCLTMAPRFDSRQDPNASRRPLLEVNNRGVTREAVEVVKDAVIFPDVNRNPRHLLEVQRERAGNGNLHLLKPNARAKMETVAENGVGAVTDYHNNGYGDDQNKLQEPNDCYLSDLFKMLASLMAAKPNKKLNIQEDEAEDPAAVPMLWVSKWVDYSDKYGLGYMLCDNSVGVIFNDSTKLILLADGDNIHYVEKDSMEHYYSLNSYPEPLNKKVTLLKYFRNYMNEHLLKAGEQMTPRDGDELARLPCLRTWFRTRSAIILHLSNGTLQINFFQDHTKLIVCPLMGAVTYIDEKRGFRTYKASLLEKYGCSASLFSRLRYANTMVERMMTAKAGTSKSSKS